ncbi:MAG: glutaminyl-peptide cyclotransferase [Rikenellaceae bacterium]
MRKFGLILLTAMAIASHGAAYANAPKQYGYIVRESFPHATDSYTQGFEISDGVLYESTGLYGASRLMKHDISSGGRNAKRTTIATLPRNEFGEGITIVGDSIFMLTWREGRMHIFNKKSGERVDTKRYAGEGWGITSNDGVLYMSDGSPTITKRDRKTFMPIETNIVTMEGRAIEMINELEWIEGKIWANIYQSDKIVIIDPESWVVEGVIDLTGILPQSERTEQTDVLNGIAYDKATKKIYVTGKNWSKMFQIEIFER